jgi:aldehyde:ferredoxin oxidoreductase
MANGYNGKILRVNLTNGSITADKLDELFCRRYIGGAGFVTYYMMKELQPGIDALGVENKLMFMMGPMTGLSISGSGRNCVGCKSPLTGGYAKSEVGGFWGAEVRRAGFDGIIIEGKSPKPVYLWIKDGEVQLKDAAHLWGKPTKETEEIIRAELGDARIRVSSIGPGGENLVRYACVMNDLKEAAGRGGTGAVMGSKNLKAIAARGNKTPEIANPDSLAEYRQYLMDNKERWLDSSLYGTGSAMENYIKIGNTPVNNFRDGEFPEINKISARALKDTGLRTGMEGCYACFVR